MHNKCITLDYTGVFFGFQWTFLAPYLKKTKKKKQFALEIFVQQMRGWAIILICEYSVVELQDYLRDRVFYTQSRSICLEPIKSIKKVC